MPKKDKSTDHHDHHHHNHHDHHHHHDHDHLHDHVEDVEDYEPIIVEITDSEGNVYLYTEEMIIPVDDDNYALLVALPPEDDPQAPVDDDDVIIAKIVTGEDGADEYIEPTDEEFERALATYNKIFDEQADEE